MFRLKKLLQLGAIVLFIGILLYSGKSYFKSTPETQLSHFSSAGEMVNAIRQGQTTSVELLNLHLDRIQRYNDGINAVIALDVDAARKRAAEADKAIMEGKDWGPLHGLPMTVKDVFEVIGMPATSGDPKLKDYIPKQNAIAVQRLIDAGAIVFGKTNVPYHGGDIQSYNEIYGTTNNPWDLSRTPGGSSGGSTAALAVGFTPLELGSDIGGSLRNPAHYTGVFGHKPTFGIIPRYGHIPPMPGRVSQNAMPAIPLFVVGPLARNAEDLELALEVLTTTNSMEDGTNRPKLLPPRRQQFKDYRVAVWLSDPYAEAEIDDDVLAVLKMTVEKLRGAGLDIDEKARPNIDLMGNVSLFRIIHYQMMIGALPLNKVFIERQKKQQTMWAELFERYDVLLAPISPTVAFPHDHKGTFRSRRFKVNGEEKPMHYNITWAVMAIVSGLPATVAPVGRSESGLPVGIQIIGARLEDRTTIAFAKGLSELMGGFVPPPGYDH
jgi:amidase